MSPGRRRFLRSVASVAVASAFPCLPRAMENPCVAVAYEIMGTVTGRLSCSSPEWQNLSNTPKRAAVHPAFLGMDFATLERRIVATENGPHYVWSTYDLPLLDS